MFEERLLERIANLETVTDDISETLVSRAIGSVMRHLQKMLNTRQGNVSIAEDYGLPDMTNYAGGNMTDICQRMTVVIKQFIEKYEPRLAKVQITFEPDEKQALSLRFKLEGVLVREHQRPIMLETAVDSSGKVIVTN
jgi:type VI secretion system protein